MIGTDQKDYSRKFAYLAFKSCQLIAHRYKRFNEAGKINILIYNILLLIFSVTSDRVCITSEIESPGL